MSLHPRLQLNLDFTNTTTFSFFFCPLFVCETDLKHFRIIINFSPKLKPFQLACTCLCLDLHHVEQIVIYLWRKINFVCTYATLNICFTFCLNIPFTSLIDMLYLICSHKHKDVNKELLFFMWTYLLCHRMQWLRLTKWVLHFCQGTINKIKYAN